MVAACAVLERLAADLVDGRSLYEGAPWGGIAGDLDALHHEGRTLADLAEGVRRDLGGGGGWGDGAMAARATNGSG